MHPFLDVSWINSRLTFKVAAVQWICATFLVYYKRVCVRVCVCVCVCMYVCKYVCMYVCTL